MKTDFETDQETTKEIQYVYVCKNTFISFVDSREYSRHTVVVRRKTEIITKKGKKNPESKKKPNRKSVQILEQIRNLFNFFP